MRAHFGLPSITGDDSDSLRTGLVTGVSNGRSEVEIQGRTHRIDANKTKVVRAGSVVKPEALQKGQIIKFTVLPGTERVATLGVVYVP